MEQAGPWRAISNHASTTTWELNEGPWNHTDDFPPCKKKTKTAFRKWCLNDQTEHLFFSSFEGVNEGLRIEEGNPTLKMFGWVADYDAEFTIESFLERVEKLDVDLKPRYVSQTFSGGLRAVWCFKEPVWADCPSVLKKIVSKFALLVKATTLAPGLDTASYDPHMTWELGTNWTEVPDSIPTPARTTQSLFFESVLQTKKVDTDYTDIPLKEIQEQIEEKHPGRLFGAEIEIGQRIPLFWLPLAGDGKEKDKSAMVAEWGVYSYSSRAEKGRMFWDELLGNDFVRKFKEKKLFQAADGIYYDGTGYWAKGIDGNWVGSNRDDTVLRLKVERSISSQRKPKETASEVEHVLYHIQMSNRVDATAPFTFTDEPFYRFNGQQYLNINRRRPMNPYEGGVEPERDFPWLWNFLENFFHKHPKDKTHPKDHFYAELQRAYSAFLESRPTSGHVNIICGEGGKGKSFLITYILREIFGSATDAGGFLVEGKGFNKELAESAVWFVDDNKSTSTLSQHKNFSETLKKHTATPELSYQPKFKDSRQVPWYGRIFLSCNDDADSISIIPDLDINIREKLNLFRVNPDSEPDFKDNTGNQETVQQELPYFLRWLLDFEIPEELLVRDGKKIDPRYGVLEYHHDTLVDTAKESSSQFRLSEILDLWRMEYVGAEAYWEGGSTELLKELSDQDLGLIGLVKSYTPITFGRSMNQLYKHEDSPAWLRMADKKKDNKSLWRITLPTASKKHSLTDR